MATLTDLSLSDLKAMEHELKEQKNLYEASGNTDAAMQTSDQLMQVKMAINEKLSGYGGMLKS